MGTLEPTVQLGISLTIIVRFHFIHSCSDSNCLLICGCIHKCTKLSLVVVLCAVDATEDDVKALVAEMEMLSSIGPHENIVSMLRVCTVGSEYCACVHAWSVLLYL